jgi:hypothetical protein
MTGQAMCVICDYCQRKIQLRPAETLEPNEREDILDDEVLSLREWVSRMGGDG